MIFFSKDFIKKFSADFFSAALIKCTYFQKYCRPQLFANVASSTLVITKLIFLIVYLQSTTYITQKRKRKWTQHVNYFNFMFFWQTEKSWSWINIKLGHLIQKKSRIILMPKIPQNYDGLKVGEKSNWCWLMCLEAYVLYNQLALLILKPTRFTWWLYFAC